MYILISIVTALMASPELFLYLLIGFAFIWIIMAIASTMFVKKMFKKYSRMPKLEFESKYKHVLRQDFGKWDQQKILRGCWTTFPGHFMAMAGFLFFYGIYGVLNRYLFLPKVIIQSYRRRVGRMAMKVCYNIKQQFDVEAQIKTPLIISNHVAWSDIIYFGTCLRIASFVSMKAVQKMPVISSIARYIQTIYVDRDSKQNKQEVKQQILERVRKFEEDPKNNYPIIIFPEATVSNGRGVLQFKNGAFEAMTPLTLMSLRYSTKQFHHGMDHIDIGEHFIVSLCLKPTLQVNSAQISPNEGQTLESYRERCRAKIAEMGGFELSECGYRDVIDIYKQVKAKLKEQNPQNNP